MKLRNLAFIISTLVLTACGGGGDNDNNSNTPIPPKQEVPVEVDGKSIGPGAGRDWTDDEGNKVVLGPTSYLLSKAQNEVAFLDSAALKLTIPGNVGQGYSVGDVLITDRFEGLLAKITGVRQDGENIIYDFVIASLEEAFEVFQVNFDKEIKEGFNNIEAFDSGNGLKVTRTTSDDFMAEHITYKPAPVSQAAFAGRSMSLKVAPMADPAAATTSGERPAQKNKPKGISLEFNKLKVAGGELKGNVFYNVDPKVSFDLTKSILNPSKSEFTFNGAMTSELMGKLTYHFDQIDPIERQYTIFSSMPKKSLKKFLWFPVAYKPYFDFDVKTKIQATGFFEINNTFVAVSDLNVLISNAKPNSFRNATSSSLANFKINSYGSTGGAEVSFPSMSVGVMLFNIGGAHVTGDINSKIALKALTNPYWNSPEKEVKVEQTADLSFGFKMNPVFKDISYGESFFNFSLKDFIREVIIDSFKDVVKAFIPDLSKTLWEQVFKQAEATLFAYGGTQGVYLYIDGAFVADLSKKKLGPSAYRFMPKEPGTYWAKVVYARCYPVAAYDDCTTPRSAYYQLSTLSSGNIRIDDQDTIKLPGVGTGHASFLNNVGDEKHYKIRVVREGSTVDEVDPKPIW